MSLSILKKKIQERLEPIKKFENDFEIATHPGPYRARRELEWFLEQIEEIEKEEKKPTTLMPAKEIITELGGGAKLRERRFDVWSGRSKAEVRELMSSKELPEEINSELNNIPLDLRDNLRELILSVRSDVLEWVLSSAPKEKCDAIGCENLVAERSNGFYLCEEHIRPKDVSCEKKKEELKSGKSVCPSCESDEFLIQFATPTKEATCFWIICKKCHSHYFIDKIALPFSLRIAGLRPTRGDQ